MAGIPGPGDRIEARCTRCNDVTGHVVVALVGGQIVKVECRACGSVHKYYPPVSAKTTQEKTSVRRIRAGEDRKNVIAAAASTSAPPQVKNPRTGHTPSKSRAAEEMEQAWQKAINLSAATPRPYAMDQSFVAGDIIEHVKFGLGVVQEMLPPDKIQVLFRDGGRLLRCAG